MASLHKLLSDDGFQRQTSRKPKKNVKFKFKDRDDTISLPIYICHDLKSFDSSRNRSEKAVSVKTSSIRSKRSNAKSSSVSEAIPQKEEPSIDDAAIKAMISILSGYAGQYLRDTYFRARLREKCRNCFEKKRKNHSDREIFSRLELGIQSIERLVEIRDFRKEMDLESLQKCIKILKIVASETVNSYLSACANLYLSIVYKLAKNDKISARHLLEVFNESPRLARTYLLPELWEHFFLPHLLHLKTWYTKELDFIAISGYEDKDKRIKALKKQHNEQVDGGTVQFALYYKEWLRIGSQAPSVPSVPLPSKPGSSRVRRKSADSYTSYQSSDNKQLYQTVFGPTSRGKSLDLVIGNGSSKYIWNSELGEKAGSGEELEDFQHHSHVQKKGGVVRRISSGELYRIPDIEKTDYFWFLGCRTEPVQSLVSGIRVSNDEKIEPDGNDRTIWSNDVSSAVTALCTSESLSDCEMAIRKLSEAWIDSRGDSVVETALSQASVIQSIVEVLYVSNSDEILELAISILAELASRSDMNKQWILNSDPNLEVLLGLLRSGSLFLKAAVLLYLLKPKGKQMVLSSEWIPLVLRVLEFGDHLQTLFSVRCSPHDAAYYFLQELLTGSYEDKNLENAKQIISLSGLSLLVRRMDIGDVSERRNAAAILHYCIQADGTCRHYLAKNLKIDTVLSLLVLGKASNSCGHALSLLTELLCLSRGIMRMEFLTGLKKGWDCLNAMHILLSLLQRAQPEERPVIAVILLYLDLMGDPPGFSVYREEAIDAIVKALDYWLLDENVQEQSARALLILGGHFSYTGEAEVEKWLLKKACLNETQNENTSEEKENWAKKATKALLGSGDMRLISALSNSIANSIPCLARASLVTVCWMSDGLRFLRNNEFHTQACSILIPRLIECLNGNINNATCEENILISLALNSLAKGTESGPFLQQWCLDKRVVDSLHELSRVTSTAKELISLIKGTSSDSSLA